MNFGWRFEPSRQSRRMVSPILGLSQRRIDQREVVVEVGAGDRREDRDDLLGSTFCRKARTSGFAMPSWTKWMSMRPEG